VTEVRSHLAAAAVVALCIALATIASVAAGQLVGEWLPMAPAAAAAAVVAGMFAWRMAEGLVGFGIFALMAESIEHWSELDLLLFDEISVLLFLMVGAVRIGLPWGRFRIGVPEVALLVLGAAGIASSVAANVPLATWASGFALLFKGILFLYIVSWLPIRPADLQRIQLLIIGVCVLLGVLGLVEFLNPSAFQQAFGLPSDESTRGDVTVVRSLFLHPAQYGWLTAFAALFLYARFIVLRSWWALPLALMLNVGTVLSGRRTPVLGLVAGLGVAMVWQLRHKSSPRTFVRAWLPIAAVVVLLAALSVPTLGGFYRSTIASYLPPMEKLALIFSDRPDAHELSTVPPRTALYVGSIAVARDHLPLGAGLGRFGSHLSREDYSPVYAAYGLDRIPGMTRANPNAITDTFWPMVLGETGIVGLAAALIVFSALFATLWRNASAAASGAERAFALGALLVFAEALVRSLTATVFVAPPIAYFVFGAAGISIALRRTTEATDPHIVPTVGELSRQ
jgi:hypothetical protein